jgi:hypothetical protein
MLRKRPPEPLARRRGADQSVEEHSPIPIRQDERFMLRNRPPGCIRERGHAEIRQFAPFELRCPFNQSLGRFVDAKPKPFFPKPSVVLCCYRHGHLIAYTYVDWTNFSRLSFGNTTFRTGGTLEAPQVVYVWISRDYRRCSRNEWPPQGKRET